MVVDYIVAAGIIRRDDEVLLVCQRLPSGVVGWSLPGGIVEPFESLAGALDREIAEETGLAVERIVAVAYVVHANRPSHGDRTIATIFEVEATGELAIADPDGEVLDVAFVDVPVAIDRLQALPWRVMGEPAIEYLEGRVPAGALWSYHEDRSDGRVVPPSQVAR